MKKYNNIYDVILYNGIYYYKIKFVIMSTTLIVALYKVIHRGM